jgi:hypothetical protein
LLSADLSAGQHPEGDFEATIAGDRHFTPGEVGKIWHLSSNMIRRLFEDEEGVLKIGKPSKTRKRKLVQMRIPERVLLRVHAKLSA